MSETVQTLILSAHILVGILLVSIILIQRGKGSDAGMAFGGGASDTVFGAAGSGSFLTKTTKWLAVAFFCSSLALAFAHNNQSAPTSILDKAEDIQQVGEALPVAVPMPGDAGNADGSLPQLDITTEDGVSVTAAPVTTAAQPEAGKDVVQEKAEAQTDATNDVVEEPKPDEGQ